MAWPGSVPGLAGLPGLPAVAWLMLTRKLWSAFVRDFPACLLYRQVVLPRGLGINTALRWQFTGDNEQPPTADMVKACWNYTSSNQFPNAKLKASTLDAFAEVLWSQR